MADTSAYALMEWPIRSATNDEVAEVESLAATRGTMHWPTLLRIIARMRRAEAERDALDPRKLATHRTGGIEDAWLEG